MKKIWFAPLLICFVILFTHHNILALEQDDPTTTDPAVAGVDTPEFSNPAQAAHAENLAEAFASEPHPDTKEAAQAVQEAEANLAKAEAELAAKAEDELVAKAEDDLVTKAEKDLAIAQAALDKAVGELAGVTEKDISNMRDDGMGWGQIAHELGVHPGVIGRHLGHMKNLAIDIPENLPANFEIAEATKRDVKHGWTKGHGMSTSVASSGKKGLGLSEKDLGIGGKGAKSSKGDRGSAGRGPSNDRGNSGNSSSGKSKSDRSSTTGGQESDKGNNGNNGNEKGNSGNKGGNSGKSK